MNITHFDAIVVGSGFGGSVMSYRLAEAGLRVCLLERVWAIQTDVTRWTTWLRDIDAMTLEDSLSLEPGSVFRW